MTDSQRATVLEELAKIAARLAGRDPDEHVKVELAGVVAFDDVVWRYPDFLERAQAAYSLLDHATHDAPAPAPDARDTVNG